jgi:flagellar biosynthesis anti-sigma factor FlgM
MRIDVNLGAQQLPETNRNPQNPATAGSTSSGNAPGAGEDQAQLSGALVQVQALVAQASQLPEVRAERVSALRQAIQSGSYQSSPEKVAGAVFEHMLAGVAA